MMMSELALVLLAAMLPAMKEVQQRCPTPQDGAAAHQAAACAQATPPPGATRTLPAAAPRRAGSSGGTAEAVERMSQPALQPPLQAATARRVSPAR